MSRRISKLIQQAQELLKQQNVNSGLTDEQKELCRKLAEIWKLQNLVICGEEHNLSDDDIERLDGLEQVIIKQMEELANV